jgi:acetylglutamate kinase
MNEPLVVKVSGHELDDAAFLAAFAAALKALAVPVVVVHGGGAEISALQKNFGIEPRYLDGVRITDADSLRVVEMVLCGTVNTRLVRVLLAAGLDAQGLSGVDRGVVRASPMTGMAEDMGFTGAVGAVRAEVLRGLLAEGVTPVLSPVCLGPESALNVNADHVAGAVAAALGARRVIFLTNVPGVMVGGVVQSVLSPQQVQALISDGTIFGGMIPKVQTALTALSNGAREAVITNLEGLASGGGTAFRAGE